MAAMRRIRVSMQEWSKHKQLAASETMSLGKVVCDDKHVVVSLTVSQTGRAGLVVRSRPSLLNTRV